VDFHDTLSTPEQPWADEFRHLDAVGLSQGMYPEIQDANDPYGEVRYSDIVRSKYATNNMLEFVVHRTAAGEWLNYTRNFPANQYIVYGRLASDTPYGGADFALVTSGRHTGSQTTVSLGTFSDPNANGFQSWHWIPLMTNGQTAVITLSGEQTLKVTAPGGNPTGSLNANYYMFVPYLAPAPAFSLSASASGGVVSIKIPTTSGHTYYVYWSSSLNPTSWTQLGSSVAGDGTVKTVTDSTGGAARFYKALATTP